MRARPVDEGDAIPGLDGVRHSFVEVSGVRIHLAEAGSGPPLILQHGWPQHWWAWRCLIPVLAEQYRVICPDLRGHGWSEAPPGPYSMTTLAGDLLGLLDALQLERVRLVGHDWGGWVGFRAALIAPSRFERFVALSVNHLWPRRGLPSLRAALGIWYQSLLAAPFVGQQTVRRPGAVPLGLRISRRIGRWEASDLHIYAERFRQPARGRATSSLYRTFLSRELLAYLTGRYRTSRLDVPTLLLIGDRDPVVGHVPLGGFEEYATTMQAEWIPGAGHWLLEETPEQLLAKIEPFLAAGRVEPLLDDGR